MTMAMDGHSLSSKATFEEQVMIIDAQSLLSFTRPGGTSMRFHPSLLH